MIIDLPRFLKAQQPGWQELDRVLTRLETDPGATLDVGQVKEFHLLYQRASADLAKLQTFASEPETCRYLESLVARAYAEIHETRSHTQAFNPVKWFLEIFPAVFQRHILAFWLSLAITLAGAAFGGTAILIDPDAKEAVLPFSHLMGNPAQRVAKEEAAKTDRMADHKATFSSQLMVNNIRVSILAFAFGMTCGVGTMILLFYNGVILGAVVADYLAAGQGVFLAGWLLPHGSIEIPAILIAGQAGLLLGSALIGQGSRLPLSERLRELAPSLATLIGGVAVMLVWAGLIESFVSQYHQPVLPYWVKISFGTLELILLTVFLTRRLPVRAANLHPTGMTEGKGRGSQRKSEASGNIPWK